MEIKIACECGSRFAFEMEPVDGRMPYEINCPECNTDITEAANADIAVQLGAAPAPVPVTVPPTIAAPETNEEPEVEVMEAADEESPVEDGPPKKKKKRKKKKKKEIKAGPNYILGFIGGCVGAAIGMGLWYALARYWGLNIGLVAWVVGGLVGFGSMLGAQEQSDGMGILSGLLALFAIFGGQYLAIAGLLSVGDDVSDAEYEYEVGYAKRFVAAKDDKEFTAVLRDYWEIDEVSPLNVKEFKEQEMPFMRKLATGSATKADLLKHWMEGVSTWEVFKGSFGIFMYICIFFGVGTAYRLAGGGTED